MKRLSGRGVNYTLCVRTMNHSRAANNENHWDKIRTGKFLRLDKRFTPRHKLNSGRNVHTEYADILLRRIDQYSRFALPMRFYFMSRRLFQTKSFQRYLSPSSSSTSCIRFTIGVWRQSNDTIT